MNYLQQTFIPVRNIALVVAIVAVTGCGNGTVTSASSYSSDISINGTKTSSKSFARTHNGITRKLETHSDVDFQNGRLTRFSKGAVVSLHESAGVSEREAELRENAGKMDLWIKEEGAFRRGSADEDAWAETFLADVLKK